MARGGSRPGAGRPKGAKDKLDREAADAAALEGIMPRDFMLGIMRDDDRPIDLRLEAAKAAAPYVHARLSAIEHSGGLNIHEDALDRLR